MNPNQMNIAKTMVARHEMLEEARRSHVQAKAAGGENVVKPGRTTFPTHPLLSLIGLNALGRR
jgi:hypothetical protein